MCITVTVTVASLWLGIASRVLLDCQMSHVWLADFLPDRLQCVNAVEWHFARLISRYAKNSSKNIHFKIISPILLRG